MLCSIGLSALDQASELARFKGKGKKTNFEKRMENILGPDIPHFIHETTYFLAHAMELNYYMPYQDDGPGMGRSSSFPSLYRDTNEMRKRHISNRDSMRLSFGEHSHYMYFLNLNGESGRGGGRGGSGGGGSGPSSTTTTRYILQRPSILHARLQLAILAIQTSIASCTGIDLQTMITRILISESYDPSISNLGTPVPSVQDANLSLPHMSLVRKMARWYVELIEGGTSLVHSKTGK